MIVESYKTNFRVNTAKADAAFNEVDKQAKQSVKTLKQAGKETVDSTSAMTEAFSGLVKKVVALFAIAAVAKFAKDVAETSVRLKNMTFGSTTTSKSLKALENAFKLHGLSAQEADAGFEAFQRSVADLKYKGELGGIAEVLNKIGVAIFDSQGKVRDYYDVIVEAGEKALQLFKGDAHKAREYLIGQGMDVSTATLATQKNARQIQKTMTEQAAASDRTAEAYLELNKKIAILDEKFRQMFLEFAERSGAIQILIDLLNTFSRWCQGEPSKSVTAFFSALDGMASAIKAVVTALTNMGGMLSDYVIQPIVKFFDLIGEAVSNISGSSYKSKEKWFGNGNTRSTIDLTGTVVNASNMASGVVETVTEAGQAVVSAASKAFESANIPSRIKRIASIISGDTGLPADFIATHLGFESTWGKSELANAAHNFGGLTAASGQPFYQMKPGGKKWLKFPSDEAFAKHYGPYLLRKYPLLKKGVQTVQQYLYAIHHGKGGVDYAPKSENPDYDGRFMRTHRARFGGVWGGSGGGGVYATPQANAMSNAAASASSSSRVNTKSKRRTLPTIKTDSHDTQETETSMLAGAFSGNISMLGNLFHIY